MTENISERNRTITKEQALNSIYIDFEGEGKKSDDPCPMPHMLGTYRPKHKEQKAIYRAYLFNNAWLPIINGSAGKAELSQFSKAIQALITEAQNRGGYLVYFSDHERNVIEHHCPDWLYEQFQSVAFNVKPPVDKMYNQRQPKNTADRPDSLENYARFYFPKMAIVSMKQSIGEVCRKLDCYCEKSQRWRSWAVEERALALKLLDYNLSDCRITFKLANKLANAQGLADLPEQAA